MTDSKFFIYFALAVFLMPINSNAQAQKVVVVPLIGGGSEIKPIKPENLIEKLGVFTNTSNRATIGTVTNERGIVLTSILVAPEQYPPTFNNISIRFCRTSGSCSHSLSVPNNTMTNIDFGIGDLLKFNGTYYIDIIDRGGLPQNVANQIILHISGYYYQK